MVLSKNPFAGDHPRAPAVPYLPPAAAAVAALAVRGCRWPFGEPAEAGFRFCAAVAVPGSSYCAVHGRAAARGGRA